jgi:hypothetical protein
VGVWEWGIGVGKGWCEVGTIVNVVEKDVSEVKFGGILGLYFCSQCLKRLPIAQRSKNGSTTGFFYPYHPKKFIFFVPMI